MRLARSEVRGLKYWHRPGFSDEKTFEEVIGRKAYQKRGMTIEPGEVWMDCGGNVGAFALLAASLGAEVHVFEPDPFNCELIEKNLRLNRLSATITQAALVADSREKATLFIGNKNQVWRNSICKKWNEQGIEVPCVNFDSAAVGMQCCKMDIEGAEMLILAATASVFDKLVYEWSFDIDPSLERLWRVMERQQAEYRIGYTESHVRFVKRDRFVWPTNAFPKCTNVFCFRESHATP